MILDTEWSLASSLRWLNSVLGVQIVSNERKNPRKRQLIWLFFNVKTLKQKKTLDFEKYSTHGISEE